MLRYARAMQIAADPATDRREYAKKLYKLIAPEGDSQLALFSQYASGELTAEQLKKKWAEKTIGNEKKINQYFKLYQNVNGTWTAVPGAEYRGFQEDEVKNRVWMKYGREALDSGEYQLVNMSDNQQWEVYDVKTGETLEIVQGANKGAAADQVFDKYANQGIGFNVRPYVDPATLTPRAKLAKRITTKKPEPKQVANQATNERGVPYWEIYSIKDDWNVIHTFLSDTAADAKVDGANWLTSTGVKYPDAFAVRPKIKTAQSADDKQDSADLQARLTDPIQDIQPDVAQNFGNQFSGQWRVVDGAGREVYRFRGVGNNQADANRIASTWARENSYTGALDVLPVMIESVDPISSAGARAPVMPPKLKPQPPVKPIDPAVKLNVKKQESDPYAQTYKKPVEENFADGKGPGRPGDSQRHGIPKGATMAQLEKAAKAPGRKGQLARWQLNMRRGKKK
jgi:hypothetical protein